MLQKVDPCKLNAHKNIQKQKNVGRWTKVFHKSAGRNLRCHIHVTFLVSCSVATTIIKRLNKGIRNADTGRNSSPA